MKLVVSHLDRLTAWDPNLRATRGSQAAPPMGAFGGASHPFRGLGGIEGPSSGQWVVGGRGWESGEPSASERLLPGYTG